jgi:rsbT antagonist protein RsbS
MQVARDVVVASIQVDLDDAVLAQFREDLLRRLQESGCHGVILDVSGLDTLDAEEFAALRHVITMTRIMGARSVLAGLRPGVVSALIESGIDTDADDPDERDDESASASDSLSDAEAGR